MKCLTFKLTFRSTAKTKIFTSTMTAEVTLHYDPDDMTISGEGPLVNEAFDFESGACSVTNIPGGGTFKVFDMDFDVVDEIVNQTAAVGKVRDLALNYYPGNSSESATLRCAGTGPVTIPPFPAWTGAYGANHLAEVNGTGMVTTRWELVGGELFAEKSWSKNVGGVDEGGSFELRHTPGA
jgi:hypothetical protein